MKIGILGTEDTLGHDVMMGSREPDQQSASSGTFADAAKHADLAIVATRWDGRRW